MASAFIIVVHSEFQPDLNQETTALLRIIIHTLNNTAFGDQVPAVPQWTGPPRRVVQVQAILFASLSASLLSALLAMLGKQWLNRCTPVDTRGTIIQRSQHRQRKFDGIRNWYFDYVMEALPLMLQAALLLLSCALSRYLWEIDTTVTSVVLGFTGFGLLFYVFIVIAGAVSENCPYQTPAANFLRHIPAAISHIPILLHRSVQSSFHFIRAILHCVPYIFHYIRHTLQRVPHIFRRRPLIFGVLHSAFSFAYEESMSLFALTWIYNRFKKLWDPQNITAARILRISLAILSLPIWLIIDLCSAIIWILVSFTNWVRQVGLEPHTEQTTEQQIVGHGLDLRCILWTLQTSVDGPVRQAALEYLETMIPDDSNPSQFVTNWFDIFLKCIQVTNGNVTILQSLERLAETSSLFCLHMLSDVVVADPMPKVLEHIRQQFTRTFPSKTNFGNHPVSHPLGVIHNVFCSSHTESLENIFLAEGPMGPLAPRVVRWRLQWDNYRPSGSDHAVVARALVKFAQFEYKRSGERAKVPRWLLRFALHSLSQDPPPSPSVVFDSLSIVAIDLECNVPDGVTVEPSGQR